MMFFLLHQVLSFLLDIIQLVGHSVHDTDIEILLLRQQVRILQRKQSRAPRISRWEKLTLVMLARQLTTITNSARAQLSHVIVLVKPETLLKWHREIVLVSCEKSIRATQRAGNSRGARCTVFYPRDPLV